jgi:hypothetical protein
LTRQLSRWPWLSFHFSGAGALRSGLGDFALGITRFDPRVHQSTLRVISFTYVVVVYSIVLFAIPTWRLYCSASPQAAGRSLSSIGSLCDGLANRLQSLRRFFLLSPLSWFHGIVALTYGVEAFFSALVGYRCWLAFCGDHRWIPVTGLVLRISAGVRPSSVLLLGPSFCSPCTERRSGTR